MSKASGGTAPPWIENYPNGAGGIHLGLSIRDYFAAKALQGMLAAPIGKIPDQTNLSTIAMDAYVAADGMLEARK